MNQIQALQKYKSEYAISVPRYIRFNVSDTAERLTPHVIGLQTEVEGTKGSVNKLEKKVNKIGQDISTIDNNMREILKHITNLQKLTPLEPLQQTPFTPSSAHAHSGFNFSFDNSVQYTSACDSSPMNSDSGFMHERKEFEPESRVNNVVTTACSYNTGNSSDKAPFLNNSILDTLPNTTSIIPELFSRTSEEARQTDVNKNLRANKSNDDLLDSSSLHEHDTLVRRHSDGPEKMNKKEQTMIVTKDIRPGTTDLKANIEGTDKETKHSNIRNVNFKDVSIPIQSDTDSSHYDDIKMFAKRHYGTNPFIDYHNSPLHDLVTDETRLLNNYTEIHLNGCNAIDSDYRTSTSESYDVSPETPDGATDISESIKTEDEELIPGYTSTNTHTPVTHVHKRCDGIILRTTDL